MTEVLTFGAPQPQVQYTERRAAYVVIVNAGQVALVKGRHKHFLPGGGALPHETPAATIVREVAEELARGVRLLRPLGEAIQYFYSSTDDKHYRMHATFFAGEFTSEQADGTGEHELDWLPLTAAACGLLSRLPRVGNSSGVTLCHR